MNETKALGTFLGFALIGAAYGLFIGVAWCVIEFVSWVGA